MKFEEMHFSEKMKKALRDLKYENSTEVQEQSIPALISGENVICKSYTGSGKTLAFGIGASERLLNGKSNGVLIVGPTRELVVQVREELHKLNRHTGLKVSVVYGGHGMNYEVQAIKKGVDILVATPGRLLDHIKQGVIRKDLFDVIILDEADRMLDMGFIEDIKKVLDYFKPKNTHLFSATLDGSVAKLINKYIPTYKEIIIKTEIIGTNIIEKNIDVRPQDKFLYLLEVVKKSEGKRILVFVSTKREAENVERKLNKSGFFATSIHGDKSQKYREVALKDFKAGKVQILIATDVAARGLQIDNVEFVVNYDTARDKDTHKHRIGRTGRMGAKGIAVNFLTDDDKYKQERREGRRPVRSQHSIDDKNVNVWDMANKSRGRFNNRDDRRIKFGHRNDERSNDRSDRPRRSDGPKRFDDSRKSFGDKKYGENRNRFDDKRHSESRYNEDDKSKGFESRTYQDKKQERFVPKSFRRDKDYMTSRPEYKNKRFENSDNKDSKFSKDKPRKSFGDRPKRFDDSRKSFGDRPKRDFGDRDKPKFGMRDKENKKGFAPKEFRGKKKFGNRR